MSDERLGASAEFEVLKINDSGSQALWLSVATEVPCTIVVNGREAVTTMLTPTFLEEFAVGHLFSAGVVHGASEITSYRCDEAKWRLDVETARAVDWELLGKRVYTSGCGKGVMYASVIELSARHPLAAGPRVRVAALAANMKWLLSSSTLFQTTHGVHSAALSIAGELPDLLIDDIGRHNAVDKIIGHALLRGLDLSKSILLSTGRTSSEILHKAKRAGIAVILARGAPTHQTILLAREMGVTVATYRRSGGITVYSHRDRVVTEA